MSPEDIRAEADAATAAFAKLLSSSGQETTGIPKPTEITVSETETDVEKFGLLGKPESGAQPIPPGQGGHVEPPPPTDCGSITATITGLAINEDCYPNGFCDECVVALKFTDLGVNGAMTIPGFGPSDPVDADWCDPNPVPPNIETCLCT